MPIYWIVRPLSSGNFTLCLSNCCKCHNLWTAHTHSHVGLVLAHSVHWSAAQGKPLSKHVLVSSINNLQHLLGVAIRGLKKYTIYVIIVVTLCVTHRHIFATMYSLYIIFIPGRVAIVSYLNDIVWSSECNKSWTANKTSLRWRINGHNGVSNHQPHDCLLNSLFGRRSKKTSKFRVTGLCAGNSPGTGEVSAQMASNAENVSIWWRNHVGRRHI